MTQLTGVGATSLLAAGLRAAEARRPDRLFTDPLAEAALAEAEWWQQPHDPAGQAFVAVRTRRFDDFVVEAAEAGVRQVVNLGAGLDSRPFRLPLPPDLWWYEIDQLSVLRFKERVVEASGLRARCRRQVLTGDLSSDWSDTLRAAGFDAGRPTAWLLEGVLAYQNGELVHGLMTSISSLAAPGSFLAATAGRPDPGDGRRSAGWRLPTAADVWLRRYGWSGRSESVAEMLAFYGRAPQAGSDIAELLFGTREIAPGRA